MPAGLHVHGVAAAALGLLAACATSNGDGASEDKAPPIDYRATVAGPAQACEAMAGFARADVTILWAVRRPDDGTRPDHCEVRAVIAPAINVRVQLPDAWNGRFYMAGNGGLAGEPVDNRTGPGGDPTAEALRRGFASAITDTGHDRRVIADASFATDPQLLEDYAWRAVHETALLGKALARDYYARPELIASYFEGCSTGGRQGLMEAQRFPDDFDGVIAGAPISDYTGTIVATMWTTELFEQMALTEAQIAFITSSYDAECDDHDGLADGVVANFEGCAFEPDDLAVCAGDAPADDCLTTQQIARLGDIVGGPMANGRLLHAGLPLSSAGAVEGETSPWNGWWIPLDGATPRNLAIHNSSWAYMVLDPPNPNWDWRRFNFVADPPRLATLSALIDATDPNLDAFRDRGGKLLMYHGAADPGLVFGMSAEYRHAVRERYGEDASEFYRLFALPGMYHCRGGYGPDSFDKLEAIVQWVEGGPAPDGLVARQVRDGVTLRARPLCDHPSYARYVGGDPDDAASFRCATP